MEIIILKNDKIFARTASDNGTAEDFRMMIVDTIPEYPADKAEKGKEWELEYVDGALVWVQIDRPLTTEEKLEVLQEEVTQIKLEWKAGEAVAVGDRRYFNGAWYQCIQAHTTQSDWTPDVVPALWKAE